MDASSFLDPEIPLKKEGYLVNFGTQKSREWKRLILTSTRQGRPSRDQSKSADISETGVALATSASAKPNPFSL